ncbi:MAG: peptidase S41 [Bacteroidales bacterium]
MNRILFYLLYIGALAFLAACAKEDVPPDTTEEGEGTANTWIEKTMRTYYLWEEEIPAADRLDFNAEPETFFLSLLSANDGKTRDGSRYYYSTINKKSASTKANLGDGYSYGFEFQYYLILNLQKFALLVLYAIPDSPAGEKGLKRGDWILEINGEPVTGNSAELVKVMYPSGPTETTFGVAPTMDGVVETIAMTAEQITDNPVFLSKTIEYEGRKIGYLVYNHFTSGPEENGQDQTYDNALRKAFAQFKTDNPGDFILDLRYNNGGLVASAQLLATMLAPASALNDIFCRLTYNGKTGGYPNQSLLLDSKLINQGATGANLDLDGLFVITSARTASASEAVINGLKPYLGDRLVIVGEQTEGKNVGSLTFEDSRYDWELHPIVSRLSNKDGESDYADGFAPDFPCTETYQDTFYDLGDTREFILKQILDYITQGAPIRDGITLRSAQHTLVPLYNSLDRKQTNGVSLD